MKINGKIIYRSAADDKFYVQGEDVSFESQEAAIWYCESGEILTETEAIRAMSLQEQKLSVMRTVQNWATELASLDDLMSVINARGFGFDAVNEPSDDDLAELGIVRDDYRNGLSMLASLLKFAEGTATEGDIADRRDVIARLRTDV